VSLTSLCQIASNIFTSIEQLTDGTITTEGNSQIVPQHVLHDISCWMKQGVGMKDIVDRLRPRTVPSGYEYHTWTAGTVCDRICEKESSTQTHTHKHTHPHIPFTNFYTSQLGNGT